MKKPTPNISAGFMIAAIFFFTGCEKNNENVAPEISPDNTAVARLDVMKSAAEVNKNFEEVAITLAKALEDVHVRKAIKSEALKQFDGDYDILYKNFADTELPDGKKFKDKLADIHAAAKSQSIARARERFSTIAAQVPILNISVPVNIDEWDVENYAPLVVVRPVDYSEKLTTTVKAYDAKGNIHLLDAKATPKIPVIVIGLSERVNEDGVPKPGITPVKQDHKGARVEGEAEYMYWLYCPNLKYIESWILGKPELRVMFFCAKNPAITVIDKYFFPPSRNSVDNNWWRIDGGARRFLFSWYTEDLGNYMVYHWLEDDDAGKTSTVNQSISYKDEATGLTYNTSYSFQKQAEDVDCGRMMVNFREGSIDYNTGLIMWADYL